MLGMFNFFFKINSIRFGIRFYKIKLHFTSLSCVPYVAPKPQEAFMPWCALDLLEL